MIIKDNVPIELIVTAIVLISIIIFIHFAFISNQRKILKHLPDAEFRIKQGIIRIEKDWKKKIDVINSYKGLYVPKRKGVETPGEVDSRQPKKLPKLTVNGQDLSDEVEDTFRS